MFPGQEDAVRSALDTFASSWCRPDLKRWDYGLAARRQVLDQWATLVNAPTHAVFASENVTEAFARFVGALGSKRLAGRRVLIAGDCFPSPDARRFDNGTPSFLPFVASSPGLAWRLSPAAADLREHNLALSRRLIALADAKGYRLRSPRDDAQRGGSVMAELPEHVDPQALEGTLARHGVLVDTRRSTVRMSPGVLTTGAVLHSL
jgi:kynureninase